MAQFLDLGGGEGEVEFRVNKKYADSYNDWRRKEEVQKLKDRYGEGALEEDSSTSEDEDEIAEEINPKVEKGFLKALSALKSRDPKVYEESVRFYSSSDSEETHKKTKKNKRQKPMFLKDYERKIVLEKHGKLSDESGEEEEEAETSKNNDPSYVEQQRLLKQSLQAALESDGEEGDLLKTRVKSQAEQEKEEEEYWEWLKGRKHTVQGEDAHNLQYLHDYWNDPSLESGEKFLRDYILNRRYREQDEQVPTYEEIVGHDDDDEEEELEREEAFERQYNFRFEEPDQDFIKSYPRTLKESVRRTDDSRKEKRTALKQRKLQEKNKRKEELRELKKLRRAELEEKLRKLKEMSGDPALPIDPDALDTDFDPDTHDTKMRELFGQKYYEGEDEQKPEFSEESDAEPDYDHWTPGTSKQNTTKKKSKFVEVLEKPKPVFDPGEKSFGEFLSEYYQLDGESMGGGGFRYRTVEPNDFGLSVEEVLSAPDKELNAWASLKKTVQFRSDKEEQFDVVAYKRKAGDFQKKRRILPSLFQPEEEEAAGSGERAGRKRRKQEGSVGRRRRLEVKSEAAASAAERLSDDRMRAYGLNPKKMKNKLKYRNNME